MMRVAAGEAMRDWLKANAPDEIAALWRAFDTLDAIKDEPVNSPVPICDAESFAKLFRDIAIGRKIACDEWDDFATIQPDEDASGMRVAK